METAPSECQQVARHPQPRLPIADSKKLHNSQHGLANIERTALAMLAAAGARPADVVGLFRTVCPAANADLQAYPWYQDYRDPLPFECSQLTERDPSNGDHRSAEVELALSYPHDATPSSPDQAPWSRSCAVVRCARTRQESPECGEKQLGCEYTWIQVTNSG